MAATAAAAATASEQVGTPQPPLVSRRGLGGGGYFRARKEGEASRLSSRLAGPLWGSVSVGAPSGAWVRQPAAEEAEGKQQQATGKAARHTHSWCLPAPPFFLLATGRGSAACYAVSLAV